MFFFFIFPLRFRPLSTRDSFVRPATVSRMNSGLTPWNALVDLDEKLTKKNLGSTCHRREKHNSNTTSHGTFAVMYVNCIPSSSSHQTWFVIGEN